MALQVRNWQKFQHYKDRNPPWVKLATDTFQNYDFGCLQDASKLLALCIITLAARTKDGSIPNDLTWIRNQCNLGQLIQDDHLKELINQGFIINASNALAIRKQSACLETEGETEGETESELKKVPLSAAADGEPKPNGKAGSACRFDEFWVAYPRKENRKKAAEAWKRKRLDAKADVILGDVVRRRRDHDPWRRNIIPHPTTYLNGERWEDAITPPAGHSPANTGDAVVEVELAKLEARHAAVA